MFHTQAKCLIIVLRTLCLWKFSSRSTHSRGAKYGLPVTILFLHSQSLQSRMLVWAAVLFFGTSRENSARVPPRLRACVGHDMMPESMLSSPPTHLYPSPSHLAPARSNPLLRRHLNKNPDSIGQKRGPRIEPVFRAQNWDRVRKWCKNSGPDSGHKNPRATSGSPPTSWPARAIGRRLVHRIF